MKLFKKCIKFLLIDWWFIPFKWFFFTSEERAYWKKRDKFAVNFYTDVDVCKRGIKESYYEEGVKALIDLLKENINAVCEEGLFSKKECKHFKEWLKREVGEDE